ncbi:MAG: sulfatase-like hydrolase/transferase [Ignavibacteriales bacterium]|nr:sulfatase-like hydrolase/transferase [Ignavibacteriales bacterium]
MNRRKFIQTAGAIAGTAIMGQRLFGKEMFASPNAVGKKPNVLFIMTDQQSNTMMSCMGNTWLSTPHMDSIAKKGYRFEKNYVANPVCMPSRFSLLTGHYASEVGVKENTSAADVVKVAAITAKSALGNVFRKAGYETLYSGKTHLYGTKDLSEYGFTLDGRDAYDGPALYAEKVLAERAGGKQKKPFFLFLSFLNPHDICYKAGADKRFPDGLPEENVRETKRLLAVQKNLSPEEYWKQIPPKATNLVPITDEQPAMVNMSTQGRNWDDAQWDLYNWMYYRLTESVDAQIGRALTALKESGLEENTIIVLTSDHGEMNRAHGLITKNVMFEECQRVPLIFAGKGIKSNYVDTSTLTCNGLDFLPTICDLAGIPIPIGLPGVSLKAYLTDNGKRPNRKYIITEAYNAYQITDGRYKFTIYELSGNPEMLTDIAANPGETINYSNDPSYAEIKATLKKELMADLSRRGLTPLPQDRTIQNIRAAEKAKSTRKKERSKLKVDYEE